MLKRSLDQLETTIIVLVMDDAVMYEYEQTRQLIYPTLRNFLNIRSIHVNLIPPSMMRLALLALNECPKFVSQVVIKI